MSEIDKEAASRATADEIVRILDDKKGLDIKLLHVRERTVLTDYFVICSGTSNTQIRGLAGEVEFKMTEKGEAPLRIEGYEEGTWVVLDFGGVMVHIFNRDQRDFYKLEKLWNDADEIPVVKPDKA